MTNQNFLKQTEFLREFDSSNGGTRSNIPITDFFTIPYLVREKSFYSKEMIKERINQTDIRIYKCYDKNKKLLGEIRPTSMSSLLLTLIGDDDEF